MSTNEVVGVTIVLMLAVDITVSVVNARRTKRHLRELLERAEAKRP